MWKTLEGFSIGLTLIISVKEIRFYEDEYIYLAVSRDTNTVLYPGMKFAHQTTKQMYKCTLLIGSA